MKVIVALFFGMALVAMFPAVSSAEPKELTCRMVPVSDRNMPFQLTIDESAGTAWFHFGLPNSAVAAKFTSEFINWDYSGKDTQGRDYHAYFELNRMNGTFFTRGYNGNLQWTC